MSSNDLSTILDIINANVSSIQQIYAKNQTSVPSLNEPYKPLAFEPELIDSTDLVVAAATQLIAMLRSPVISLVAAVGGQHIATSIGAAEATNISEILSEAGPKGLHVAEIAKKADTDGNKLGRILRLLSTVHIFQEIAPDVFANNRLSSVLASGKTIKEINEDGITNKHNKPGDPGYAALFGHSADEVNKAGAYLREYMTNPTECKSIDMAHTPFQMAFKPEGNLFTWYGEPSNAGRLARFNAAMKGSLNASPMNILKAFDWNSVTDGVVVDVGGGTGSSSLMLAKEYSHLNIIVQDTESVVKDGHAYWQREYPDALENGRVKLQTHDFFTPQPVQNAAVFFLRYVLHDWPAEKAKLILKALRPSATQNTKLILLENIVPYAIAGHEQKIPGEKMPVPPTPLLPNLGVVNLACYIADMHMMLCLNSQERTLGEWTTLTEGTGWQLVDIKHVKAATMSSLIFHPV
ncbi:hypothetical protein PILCRDRAFT_823892 [Piloderma croceum F 1598]|uniref:O-methyltransferase C-terminal domain-containing protein n=1 Tax=Piloderma croceum (strain F 1598) TaxID=765440 RepID=A0A0C3F2K2_PILCF|nr:hypothetical protein PILCRDRAFT_823892 [Piloderma croceum F 1598]